MSLRKRIMRRIGAFVNRHVAVEDGPAKCVACKEGPNPALGVPIQCTDGFFRHLMCLVVGYRMTAIAKGAELQAASSANKVVVQINGARSPFVTLN